MNINVDTLWLKDDLGYKGFLRMRIIENFKETDQFKRFTLLADPIEHPLLKDISYIGWFLKNCDGEYYFCTSGEVLKDGRKFCPYGAHRIFFSLFEAFYYDNEYRLEFDIKEEQVELENDFYSRYKIELERKERARQKKLEEEYEKLGFKTYIMKDAFGYYKIGKAKNPYKREKTLMSQDSQLKLIAIHPKNIESQLHREFNNHRVRGEWFELTNEQLNEIIKKNNFELITRQ